MEVVISLALQFFPCHRIRFCVYILHKKSSFLLRMSSVNVTKSAVSCGFGHIYWINPLWETSFSVQWQIRNLSTENRSLFSKVIHVNEEIFVVPATNAILEKGFPTLKRAKISILSTMTDSSTLVRNELMLPWGAFQEACTKPKAGFWPRSPPHSSPLVYKCTLLGKWVIITAIFCISNTRFLSWMRLLLFEID